MARRWALIATACIAKQRWCDSTRDGESSAYETRRTKRPIHERNEPHLEGAARSCSRLTRSGVQLVLPAAAGRAEDPDQTRGEQCHGRGLRGGGHRDPAGDRLRLVRRNVDPARPVVGVNEVL